LLDSEEILDRGAEAKIERGKRLVFDLGCGSIAAVYRKLVDEGNSLIVNS